MIDFPCDSCISRKEGYVSCDSRYDCYLFEKWVEDSSKELEREYGIVEKVIIPWEELQRRAREFNKSRFIKTMSESTIYSPVVVEAVYNLSGEDQAFTGKVLEYCSAYGKDPIELMTKLIEFEKRSKRIQRELEERAKRNQENGDEAVFSTSKTEE